MVKRKRRREILYEDDELMPWFEEVSAGYSFQQAGERLGMDWDKLRDTLYSDDDVIFHALDLSIVAGAKIRNGQLPVPDRDDGLYDEFRP